MEITALDTNILLALNFDGGLVLDRIMWFISGKATWVPFYLFCLWFIWRKYGVKYMAAILVMAVAGVVLGDHICNFFKHNFQMLRPYRVAEIRDAVHTVWDPIKDAPYSCGRYGTASGHAATTMAIMVVVGHALRNQRWFWWVMGAIVLSVAYSRIYLGVHFLSQILLGWTIGAAVGYILVRILARWGDRLKEPRGSLPMWC